MAKTTFSSGVIVTSQFLNGFKEIYFDGQDLDHHYNPLGLESLVLKGPNGLDSRYITLGTDQPNLTNTGIFITGYPISGDKVVTGKWSFGFDESANPTIEQDPSNAPSSYLTNNKYDYAGGVDNPTAADKFGYLSDQDILTKKVLTDQLDDLVVDDGVY